MAIQLGAAPGAIAGVIVMMVAMIGLYAVIAMHINDSDASKKKKKARKELAWHALLIAGVLTIASIMTRR